MSDFKDTNFFFAALPEEIESEERRVVRQRKQRVWLENVGTLGWRKACDKADCTEQDVHRWLRIDPDFAAAHRVTQADTAARLERIADEIAAGEREGNPQQMTALVFRLKGLKPETYRERASVAIDATTRVAADGDGGKARALLADWAAGTMHQAPGAQLPGTPPNSSAVGT
jgi:hypothetical protein